LFAALDAERQALLIGPALRYPTEGRGLIWPRPDVDEIDKSLISLMKVQADIKLCRDAADRIADPKLAVKMRHTADQLEQQIREMDRLYVGALLRKPKV
jgi:hypothetical protein